METGKTMRYTLRGDYSKLHWCQSWTPLPAFQKTNPPTLVLWVPVPQGKSPPPAPGSTLKGHCFLSHQRNFYIAHWEIWWETQDKSKESHDMGACQTLYYSNPDLSVYFGTKSPQILLSFITFARRFGCSNLLANFVKKYPAVRFHNHLQSLPIPTRPNHGK